MRALGFQVKKREVLALVDEVDIHRTGRVEFSDYMEISTLTLICFRSGTHSRAVRRKVLARDPDEEIARVRMASVAIAVSVY